jgi:RNA polymerase sigma-70 factor (ECF subfamily)
MAGTPGKDRAAFVHEVLVHMPAAYNLAFLLLRTRMDAEDATQDAIVRAYRAYGQLRGDAAKPWLLAIVRNVCYRRLQERKRVGNVISLDEALVLGSQSGFVESWMTPAGRNPEEAAALASDRSLLMTALDGLPHVFREVIVLREIEELSYAEIADVLRAPVGTVMSRLSRARESLREALSRLIRESDSHAM